MHKFKPFGPQSLVSAQAQGVPAAGGKGLAAMARDTGGIGGPPDPARAIVDGIR